ncbi:SPOR domain-containing protein [Phenylobacterium sp. LjRoot225]|uniref:SPOR domain-containing protein n=1 Tax=Phenylobacterium sp. LjRoot225 TaxID=3342285 RepID=UPI003ECD1DFA
MIGLIAALAAASSASTATYPAAVDRDAIVIWLPQATGLAANQVIAVTASSAVAIVTRTRTPEGRVGVLLRALPLTPEATARGGVLAWQMRLEIDCRAGAVRLGGTTGYDTQLADGEGVALAPAETVWRPPKAGTPLESAQRAVCERDFQLPLVAAGQRLAQAAPAPAPPRAAAPAPAPLLAALRPALPAPFSAPNAAFRTPASVAPSKPGPGAIQVVSSSNPAEARQALANLQGRFTELQGMRARVEPAQVRGRAVYRGVISGFDSRDQARAFCETLKRGGRDCLAR